MNYRFLALDVDGTLIGPDNVVTRRTARAVAAAQEAGLRVCLATGRSCAETMPVWKQLPLRAPCEPMVLVGGALVSEPDTGRTLWQRTMDRATAVRFADALNELGHTAMALVDAWRHGVDYYVAAGDDMHVAARDWFSKMDVTVRRVPSLGAAAGLPDLLRISAVVEADAADALAEKLGEQFDGQLNIHAILAPNYAVTIVEAHAATVDKWQAIRYVAQAHRIPPAQIVAVGDDVNDLPAVRRAGLGVAMGGAPDRLKAAADVVAEDSLAAFIEQLIDGAFDEAV